MVDVYHELQSPQVFLQRLRETFKPGGRLVLLEFRKEDATVPILEVHKMSVAEVKGLPQPAEAKIALPAAGSPAGADANRS